MKKGRTQSKPSEATAIWARVAFQSIYFSTYLHSSNNSQGTGLSTSSNVCPSPTIRTSIPVEAIPIGEVCEFILRALGALRLSLLVEAFSMSSCMSATSWATVILLHLTLVSLRPAISASMQWLEESAISVEDSDGIFLTAWIMTAKHGSGEMSLKKQLTWKGDNSAFAPSFNA